MGLDELVARGVFASAEHDLHLLDTLAEHTWSLDVAQSRFDVEGPHPVKAKPQLLGTAALEPRTWLWAWANAESALPTDVLIDANAVRRVGGETGVPELVEAEWPLGDGLESRLVIASKALTRHYYSYACPIRPDSVAHVLLPGLGLPLPAPSARAAQRIISHGLGQCAISDHRLALETWAAGRGVDVTGEGELSLEFSDGTVTCAFDELGRISRIGAQLVEHSAS